MMRKLIHVPLEGYIGTSFFTALVLTLISHHHNYYESTIRRAYYENKNILTVCLPLVISFVRADGSSPMDIPKRSKR